MLISSKTALKSRCWSKKLHTEKKLEDEVGIEPNDDRALQADALPLGYSSQPAFLEIKKRQPRQGAKPRLPPEQR